LPDVFGYGQSVEGRTLTAHKIGNGDRVIMLVGGIHGGYEANTITLIEQFIIHFTNNPLDVLPNITLILIPSANPDGASYGRSLRGRFNANGVDLNRNWDCGWQAEAYFRDTPVYAGDKPFSEPESLALAALINDLRPAVVLFYHSAANGIYAGDCQTGGVSDDMVAILGQATGYPYGVTFTDYAVSGTASSWVDGLGIPSADVELASAELTEFSRNLAGIRALQCWLTQMC
jgi:predicted deacylase